MSGLPNTNDAAVAVLINEVKHLTAAIEGLKSELSQTKRDLREEISANKAEIAEMKTLVVRWRGGFAALLGLGAVMGYVLTNAEKVMKWFA